MRCIVALAVILAAAGFAPASQAAPLVMDSFTRPDGVIASSSCYFGSGCRDRIWGGGDSGTLYARSGLGHVNAEQFRQWTREDNAAVTGASSIRVALDARVNSIGSRATYYGVKIWTRREIIDGDRNGRATASANEKPGLYVMDFATRGRYIAVQRKSRGQDSYTILAQRTVAPPLGAWRHIEGTMLESAGGAGCSDDRVTLTLSIDGVQQLSAVDQGCAAIMRSESLGSVPGIRSDASDWDLDNFTVGAL
jgi:hypothetical protein